MTGPIDWVEDASSSREETLARFAALGPAPTRSAGHRQARADLSDRPDGMSPVILADPASVLAAPLPTWGELPVRPLERVAGMWPEPGLPQDLTEPLLLVTVQSRAAYEELRTSGGLSQSWARVEPEFAPAYRWMTRQMRERGMDVADHAPLWLWAHLSRERLLEDLLLADREDAALLVVSVPQSRTVLSVHDAWHYVMNQTWCPAPGGREDAYEQFEEAVFERLGGRLGWTLDELPPDLRKRVEASWKWSLVPPLHPAGSAVQAAVPWMWAHEVVGAARLG